MHVFRSDTRTICSERKGHRYSFIIKSLGSMCISLFQGDDTIVFEFFQPVQLRSHVVPRSFLHPLGMSPLAEEQPGTCQHPVEDSGAPPPAQQDQITEISGCSMSTAPRVNVPSIGKQSPASFISYLLAPIDRDEVGAQSTLIPSPVRGRQLPPRVEDRSSSYISLVATHLNSASGT